MSQLRLYSGPELTSDRTSAFAAEETPDVISFEAVVDRLVNQSADNPTLRARELHRNRRCRHCGSAAVEPVVLADGVRDGSGELIPGTATLVGFHCGRCSAEWPVWNQ
ncbi:hypothetical protein [Calycomorphotria hydatis]|uniref:Uncharacterized protein n=1 Tax=Calycomorphotria hydatis TaxID=2528027 RepID=A0A517T864_9PLAN|nr:hypothetical protein [Calycomorphotria hydatis]QDT64569.1 hypothetical protein V22_18040 [Calycomorphotria hydatis]